MTTELRPFTLPNLLTFARLVALPFLIVAIVEGNHEQAFWIFFAAAVSDFVDGFLARHFGMASPLGAYLDPIADKLFLVSTFIAFALRSTPSNVHIPLWLVILTVTRDLLIVVVALVMAIALDIRSFPPTFLGKANTFAEISTVVAILMNNIGRMPGWVPRACFTAVFLLTIASGLHYILRASLAVARATGARGGAGPEAAPDAPGPTAPGPT
ncbi:CDP-alcohol phosphatidyltransferase family protein [Acidobacteria bacterium ACD]|nr:MAG: CDP-alcohol phosphatidyltransferase family protein [Acidobacteriota bacterium]MCE7957682.1 CDP-alcohol phosphatidyltransferase family protein [Acidobacteria bacterium ACB2]MDL1952180.1 CDP-alcohol phosphatidyltransferase family protein [Acidobacteria bacterium ACD]